MPVTGGSSFSGWAFAHCEPPRLGRSAPSCDLPLFCVRVPGSTTPDQPSVTPQPAPGALIEVGQLAPSADHSHTRHIKRHNTTRATQTPKHITSHANKPRPRIKLKTRTPNPRNLQKFPKKFTTRFQKPTLQQKPPRRQRHPLTRSRYDLKKCHANNRKISVTTPAKPAKNTP